MRIAAMICRYLLGLMFTVFGLNGFFHFLPQPPATNPLAQQFMTAAFASHYLGVVFLVQIIGGVLLLAGRFVPLALTILAPVLVNILNFHVTMDPKNIGAGLLATLLWIVIFVRYRAHFRGIFTSKSAETAGAV